MNSTRISLPGNTSFALAEIVVLDGTTMSISLGRVILGLRDSRYSLIEKPLQRTNRVRRGL